MCYFGSLFFKCKQVTENAGQRSPHILLILIYFQNTWEVMFPPSIKQGSKTLLIKTSSAKCQSVFSVDFQ